MKQYFRIFPWFFVRVMHCFSNSYWSLQLHHHISQFEFALLPWPKAARHFSMPNKVCTGGLIKTSWSPGFCRYNLMFVQFGSLWISVSSWACHFHSTTNVNGDHPDHGATVTCSQGAEKVGVPNEATSGAHPKGSGHLSPEPIEALHLGRRALKVPNGHGWNTGHHPKSWSCFLQTFKHLKTYFFGE